jgi:hypothetical protein
MEEFLLGLVLLAFGLAFIALVGHGLWVLGRATIRGLISLFGGIGSRAIEARMCPCCGEAWDRRHGPGWCIVCGWLPGGDTSTRRRRPGVAIAELRRRVERYHDLGLLSRELRDDLERILQAGTVAPAAPAAQIRPRPVPAAAPATVEEPVAIELDTDPTPVPLVAAVAEPAAATVEDALIRFEEPTPPRPVAEPAAPPPDHVPPLPKPQRLLGVLSAFLEEKSIRWGELVGGLLIVGCSLALVISFWSSIAERPLLKYVLFNGVTALLFALGHHAGHRWRLPTTALGLLIIAAMLVPLNFLAVASLVRGASGESAWAVAGEVVAVGLFAALLLSAGRPLVAAAPWALLIGVLGPSATMLLVRRSVDPGRGLHSLVVLGALPLLALSAAVGGGVVRVGREREIREERANELLRLLGLAAFATAVVLGLVLARAGPIGASLHRLAPLAPLAGASLLAPGLLLWRRCDAKDSVGYRTAGTAIAAAGTLALLAGIVLAWPDPARMLPTALLDFAALTAIALLFEVPAAHVLAGLCLVLAYLLGWLVASGRLGWEVASRDTAARALLSAGSGAALVPIVLVFGAVAAAVLRLGRRFEAQAYAMVAALSGLCSLAVVTWSGFGLMGDPSGVAWVYAAYALAAPGFALWSGRHPLVSETSAPAETRVLGWLGSALLLAALVQGIVFGRPAALALPGVVALLAHAALCATAAILGTIPRSGRDFVGAILLGILERSALATSIVAACGLVLAIPVSAPAVLATRLLGLAVIWLALAWRLASPALFAAFQGALTGSVVFAVASALVRQGWYARSPWPWLDPQMLQAQGLALGALALAWIGVRRLVRVRLGEPPDLPGEAGPVAWRLLDPPWPAFDRYIRGAVVLILVALTVYGVLPGAAQELTPRSLAARLREIPVPTSGRVVPPIVAFEVPGLPHAPALGIASWALLALAVSVLLAGQWERFRRVDLLGALLAASMAAPLLAGRWEPSVAAASALRWSSAVVLLAASGLIWAREPLVRGVSRLGWRFEPERVAGLLGLAIATAIALGMLPLLAMGAYVGTAALVGHGPDEDLAQVWTFVAVLFVLLAATSLSLRWIPATPGLGRGAGGPWRAWARPAGSLLAVLGTLPMVAVTVFAVSSALAGDPLVGPEPGSFFRRIGNAGSYVPPILLVAATLVGYAARERSSGFAFAAGLVLNVAATAGYLMAGARAGVGLDAVLCARLAQLNAIVAAGCALAWMGAAAWASRRRAAGLAPDDPLLATTVGLGVALNVVLLAAGATALFLDPWPWPALLAIAGPWGLAALALAAASVAARARVSGRPIGVDWYGLGLLCVADYLALGLVGRGTGNWLAYHALLAGQALAGAVLPLVAWHYAGLRLSAVAGHVRSAVTRWSSLALVFVVLLAIRAYWSDPQSPWWTVGGLAGMAALAVALACWSGAPGFLKVAAGLLNLAATCLWCATPGWSQGTGVSVVADLANVNVLALALPAPLWLWLERRVLFAGGPESERAWPHWARPASFQRVAAWIALGVLSLVVLVCLADEEGGASDWLGWAAVAVTAAAMAAGLWDERSRSSVAGLYLLGLCASGWAVQQLRLPTRWLAWTGTMILSAYSVGTSYLWSRRAALRSLADRLGIPRPDAEDPLAGLAWLVPANLALAALVLTLAFATVVGEPEVLLRSAAAHAALAEGLAIGLLAQGARRSRLQSIALAAVVAGAVAWGWAWIAPGATTAMLDRLAVVVAALIGAGALYGLGLTKLLPRVTEWTRAARRLVPGLLVLGGMAMTVLFGIEVVERAGGRYLPMSAWAVAAVALTLAGAVAAALVAAVVPGRDPLGLPERGRTAYVYGSEVVLAVLVAHLGLALPWLFTGMFAQYWPLIVVGVAFLGVGLSELFRRQGRLVLAEPLERTGALLPVLPLLGAALSTPRPGEDVLFLVLVGGLYTTLSLLRSSLGFGALATLACNGALWAWLGRREGLGLLEHPQFWVVPPAMCVLVGAHLNRDRLTRAQTASIRYAAALAIYLASTADIILTGVARAPWLPLVLAALAIAGVFAGILLRIRGFLFLGLSFLALALFSMIWYAAVDLRQTWLWAACGIVAGVLILALFALFEKKRQDVLRMVDQLKEWSP